MISFDVKIFDIFCTVSVGPEAITRRFRRVLYGAGEFGFPGPHLGCLQRVLHLAAAPSAAAPSSSAPSSAQQVVGSLKRAHVAAHRILPEVESPAAGTARRPESPPVR